MVVFQTAIPNCFRPSRAAFSLPGRT